MTNELDEKARSS